jgi:hypothetical protein
MRQLRRKRRVCSCLKRSTREYKSAQTLEASAATDVQWKFGSNLPFGFVESRARGRPKHVTRGLSSPHCTGRRTMMLVGIFGLAVSMLIYLLLDNADNHPEAVVRAGCSLDHPEANSMSLWQQPGVQPRDTAILVQPSKQRRRTSSLFRRTAEDGMPHLDEKN